MTPRQRVIAWLRAGVTGMPPERRELALSLASRRAPGPVMLPGPPDGPVLVVAPHPDDEVIGPGGAVARHLDRGDRVRVLLVTSGGATVGAGRDVMAVREAETRRALSHLGDDVQLALGRLPDGGLPTRVGEIAELIGRCAEGCATVYTPSLLDHHPDHHAVAVATGRAGLASDTEVYGYEVWAPGPVDVLVDVTGVFARKQAALGEYRTALETVDYVRSASGLAAYRSAMGGLGGRGFAEGFTVARASEYAELVRSVSPR